MGLIYKIWENNEYVRLYEFEENWVWDEVRNLLYMILD